MFGAIAKIKPHCLSSPIFHTIEGIFGAIEKALEFRALGFDYGHSHAQWFEHFSKRGGLYSQGMGLFVHVVELYGECKISRQGRWCRLNDGSVCGIGYVCASGSRKRDAFIMRSRCW